MSEVPPAQCQVTISRPPSYSLTLDLGDIVESLTVTLPLLNKGVNGAQLSIPNFGGAYNGLIKRNDDIKIWLSRSAGTLGTTATQAFSGRIVNFKNRGDGFGSFFIDLDCHGYAAQLNTPPALLKKIYATVNGRTIIEDALALCPLVIRHVDDDKWFDCAGASGATDDRIDSTHDIEYDEELPLMVIQEILEKATNPAGLQGFDIYETPNGVGTLIGHLRRSSDFISPVANLVPRSYLKNNDLHRVRNRQKVYGCAEKKQPLDGDSETEALTHWASDGTLSLEGTDVKTGSYSVKAVKTAQGVYAELTLTSTITTDFKTGYKKLHDWIKCSNDLGEDAQMTIILCAPDYTNSFIYWMNVRSGIWDEVNLPIGRDAAIWTKVVGGNPDWNNIQLVCYTLMAGIYVTTVTLLVDNHFFSGARFSDQGDDPTSQGSYDVREAKPVIDDALKSDLECLARANSLVNYLKEPLENMENVTADGNLSFLPGDLQTIVVANDGVSAAYPIEQVQHVVRKSVWDSVLSLSAEPQYIEYAICMLRADGKVIDRRP